MENESKILQELGLTEYQAKTLAALLARSESTADDIAKLSGVPITKIYSILKSLEDMGYVKCTPTRPKYYRPVDVRGIVDSVISKRQEKIQEFLSKKDNIISTLENLYEKSGKEYETPKDLVWMINGLESSLNEIGKMVVETKEKLCFISTPEDCKAGSSNISLMSLWMDLVLNKGVEIREIEPHMNKKDRVYICRTLGSNFNLKKDRIRFYKSFIKYLKKYNIREVPYNEVHFTMIIRDADVACVFLKQPINSNDRMLLMIYDKTIINGLLDYFNSLWKQSKCIRSLYSDLYINELNR